MTLDAKGKAYHHECASDLEKVIMAKNRLDEYERQYREKDPNSDPFANELMQACLAEYRRLNALAMAKLTPADKFEMMFKGIK